MNASTCATTYRILLSLLLSHLILPSQMPIMPWPRQHLRVSTPMIGPIARPIKHLKPQHKSPAAAGKPAYVQYQRSILPQVFRSMPTKAGAPSTKRRVRRTLSLHRARVLSSKQTAAGCGFQIPIALLAAEQGSRRCCGQGRLNCGSARRAVETEMHDTRLLRSSQSLKAQFAYVHMQTSGTTQKMFWRFALHTSFAPRREAPGCAEQAAHVDTRNPHGHAETLPRDVAAQKSPVQSSPVSSCRSCLASNRIASNLAAPRTRIAENDSPAAKNVVGGYVPRVGSWASSVAPHPRMQHAPPSYFPRTHAMHACYRPVTVSQASYSHYKTSSELP